MENRRFTLDYKAILYCFYFVGWQYFAHMTQMRDIHIQFNHEFYIFSENVPTEIEELLALLAS